MRGKKGRERKFLSAPEFLFLSVPSSSGSVLLSSFLPSFPPHHRWFCDMAEERLMGCRFCSWQSGGFFYVALALAGLLFLLWWPLVRWLCRGSFLLVLSSFWLARIALHALCCALLAPSVPWLLLPVEEKEKQEGVPELDGGVLPGCGGSAVHGTLAAAGVMKAAALLFPQATVGGTCIEMKKRRAGEMVLSGYCKQASKQADKAVEEKEKDGHPDRFGVICDGICGSVGGCEKEAALSLVTL